MPIELPDLTMMTHQERDDLLIQIRERRLKPVRIYEELSLMKAEARKEMLETQWKKALEMFEKELIRADKAMTAYDDLMDLGMNVESRYSGRVFEVAGNMLKTSLDAKTAKLDKKLKMIELQLRKEKQDKDSNGIEGDVIPGQGYVVTDRNSLLEKLKNMDK